MIHYNTPETPTDFHSRNFAPHAANLRATSEWVLKWIEAWQAEVGGTRVCQATFWLTRQINPGHRGLTLV